MDKYVENRPWGMFEQFTRNEQSTIKIISVNSHEELSLQYHHKRDEFWRVIDGEALITVGDATKKAIVGDEFFIPKTVKHQIKTADSSVKILEISFGEFDEKDIVRLKDKYNRS